MDADPARAPAPATTTRRRRVTLLVAWSIGSGFALLLMFEGCASVIRALREAAPNAARASSAREHTEYDPELGWVNRANVHLPDLYGPDRPFTTDDLAFRATRSAHARTTPARVRIVCSGDSFTMGFGVGDDDAWCRLLESHLPDTESINLGVGGYGVGQAYLRYRRNLDTLAHDVHLFAFISADFERLAEDEFLGFGKPLLQLDDDRLVTRNVPVPGPALGEHDAFPIRRAVSLLHSVEILREMSSGGAGPAERAAGRSPPDRVAAKVFEELKALSRERGIDLVLVHLPTRQDYMSKPAPSDWRVFAAKEAARLGLPFIDVTAAMRRLPRREVDTLFRGHYSERGNAFVAATIADRIRESLGRTPTGTAAGPSR